MAASGPMPPRYWVLAAICGVLPDADAIGYYLGVRYGSFLGHRGFSHSLLFALIVAILVTEIFFSDLPRFSRAYFGMILSFFAFTISHSLLDALTNGGLGVAIFSPFDETRYFLPWRPVQVSPMGIRVFFSSWGMAVLSSEFIWIWIPSIVLIALIELARRVFGHA